MDLAEMMGLRPVRKDVEPADPKKKKKRPNAEYLTPLKGTVTRRPYIVVDIESKKDDTQDPGFTRPFLVGVYDPGTREFQAFRDEPHLRTRYWRDRHYLPGGCVDKALAYMLSSRFRGYNIYAHNGGNFDHLFWLRWLRIHQDEFAWEVVPVQSSIQIIRVFRLPDDPDETVEDSFTFLDSMKLLPMGLEKAGKAFKLGGKAEHDLAMHEDDPHWEHYLERDCVLLSDVMFSAHALVEDKLGGEVGVTTPASSMKLYRRQFLGKQGTQKKIPRHQHWQDCKLKATCTGCAHEWIRSSYYGGRTELFDFYGENLRYFDINSSYAAAMKEDMPTKSRLVEEGTLDWRFYDTHVGFAECQVEIPEDCPIPPLPYRDRRTGKLLFPAGRFSGVWSMEELRLLDDPLVNGRITRVGKVCWFGRSRPFEHFVDDLYKLRDKRNPDYDDGLSLMAKLFLNGHYGKYGMYPDRTSIAFTKVIDAEHCFLCQREIQAGEGICDECVGSKSATGNPESDVWYQHKHVDAPYIIPQIASHITALARVRLWRFMRQAIALGGRIWYCDTDSIITDVDLPCSSELGALKNEYPDKPLRFIGVQPKVYVVETMDGSGLAEVGGKPSKTTMKGFPQKLRTKDNLLKLRAGMERALRGDRCPHGKRFHQCRVPECREQVTVGYDNLQKIRSLARIEFGMTPTTVRVEKSFQSEYDKRVPLPGGGTKPRVINEEEAA